MRKFLIPLTLALISQNAESDIVPEIHVPPDFNRNNFYIYYNEITSGGYGGRSCGYVSFENFYPPEYTASKIKRPPFDPWLCLYALDVIHNGYGPDRVLPEEVYFDKKTGIWKKKKYTLSKESTRNSLDVYGIKSLNELQPLELYNIRSVNTRGYAVIDSNIPLRKKKIGVKKSLSFCLIRDGAAFCGTGSMINLVDDKEVDFTPYMLKSLETVEMGLPEKSNN
ncbi:hypothetical protein [Erwinia sp. JUb26]|uniref:hypothetical protein n=1 Tax=Erwinia sp. JUb26 TaxID=2485126 RepID=UPI000F482190|nr:hypothetical protein [Erwinia sp. JUb26]ROR15278.1 hypothetical protein EC836_101779 [Erwinia sp. JUb26]